MAKTTTEILRDSAENTAPLVVSGTVYSGGAASQLIETQNLALGALSYTTAVASNFIVKGVYLVFSGAVTQDVTLVYNGVTLQAYTITTGTTSYIEGDFTILGAEGKNLTVTCTNNTTPAITATLTLDVEVI
jgi:hypothetical protein